MIQKIHYIIDTSTWIKSIVESEKNHKEAKSFVQQLSTKKESAVIWVSKYVVSETLNRILQMKHNIGNKQKILSKIWNELNGDLILNEDDMGVVQTNLVYKKSFKIMHKHALNQRAPNFIDCYQVALADRLNKKFRTEIKIAYFDQYFPIGVYTPVFNVQK